MNKNYATITIGQTVENILDKGAEELYERYLGQKLPHHTNHLNDDQFQNNLKILSLKHSC
jgi:hypothetical protein